MLLDFTIKDLLRRRFPSEGNSSTAEQTRILRAAYHGYDLATRWLLVTAKEPCEDRSFPIDAAGSLLPSLVTPAGFERRARSLRRCAEQVAFLYLRGFRSDQALGIPIAICYSALPMILVNCISLNGDNASSYHHFAVTDKTGAACDRYLLLDLFHWISFSPPQAVLMEANQFSYFAMGHEESQLPPSTDTEPDQSRHA